MSEDNLLLIQKSNKGTNIFMNFLYIWVNDVLMKFICGANHFLFFFRVGILSRRVTRLQSFNVGDVSFSEWNQ